MSEEEILKQLDNACILDKNCYEVDYLFEKDLEAIRSLLDLYNEEKEKNASLQKEIKELKKENKDHLEALTEWVNGERINDIKHISKDKIRKEKIKELEDNMILFTNDKEKFNRYKYTRDTLEKLLGE